MDANSLAGIPVRTSPFVPGNEIWLVQEGDRKTIICREGPKEGQAVEEWVKSMVCRIVNLGDPPNLFKRPKTFIMDFDRCILCGENKKDCKGHFHGI